jgi:small-conductance mechanosensitive channel
MDTALALQGALDSPQSLIVRGGLTVLVVALALVLGRMLGGLASRVPVSVETRLGRNGRSHERPVSEVSRGLSRWVGRLTLASVWVAALVAIALIWLSDQTLGPLTNQPHLGAALAELALRFGGSLLALAFALGLGRWLQRSALKSFDRRVNPNLQALIGRLIYVAILALGVVVVLGIIWNTGIVFPVALIGALTVALSLALQDVLKNLVSGIYILLERPFVIGDHITLAPYTGQVEDIQIRYTALRTANDQRVIIPNSMLFSSAVVNLSYYDRRRSGLTVTIPDSGPDALDHVEEQIHAALEGVPGIIEKEPPQVVLSGAGGGKVSLQVLFWVPAHDFSGNAAVVSDVIERVRAQVKDAEVAPLDTSASVAV